MSVGLEFRRRLSHRRLVIFLVVLSQVVPVRDGLVGAAEDGARARAVGLADEALAFERVAEDFARGATQVLKLSQNFSLRYDEGRSRVTPS